MEIREIVRARPQKKESVVDWRRISRGILHYVLMLYHSSYVLLPHGDPLLGFDQRKAFHSP
jgi:hypothetical protein